MLLIISEIEAYHIDALRPIFEQSLASDPDNLFVLIQQDLTNQYTLNQLITHLEHIYGTSQKIIEKQNISTQVTVILNDLDYDFKHAAKSWSTVFYTSKVNPKMIPNAYIQHISAHEMIKIESNLSDISSSKINKLPNPDTLYKEIPIVAVGGTFDHLHDGHKILLTAAIFLAKKTLIIGVTGHELLKNKKYLEYLESYDTRVGRVRELLKNVRPGFIPDVYEINDVCGPTAKIEDIDALVVSMESSKGATFVNKVRSDLGWKKLNVYTISVVGGSDPESFEDKLSSTAFREQEYLKNHPT